MTATDHDLDLSGVLGLDFVNTVIRTRDGPIDLLDTPADFLEWLCRVDDGGVEPSMEELAPRDPPGLRLLTVEARELRRALAGLFRRVARNDDDEGSEVEGIDAGDLEARGFAAGGMDAGGMEAARGLGSHGFDAAAAFTIDRALRGASVTYRLVGFHVRTRYERTGPLAALTPIAVSALEVSQNADPARLRACDAGDCARWFVDTSKGGRRRWCSMARCGNRAKVARYRRRQADEE